MSAGGGGVAIAHAGGALPAALQQACAALAACRGGAEDAVITYGTLKVSVVRGELREVALSDGSRLDTTFDAVLRALPYAVYGAEAGSTFAKVAAATNPMHDTAKLIPAVDAAEAERLVRGYFPELAPPAVEVSVKQVDGYDDANFKVSLRGGGGERATYLLKCYNPLTAGEGFLRAQDEVTRHLASVLGGGVGVPVGVDARVGDLTCPFVVEKFGIVRLQKWVEGVPLSTVEFGPGTAEAIGALCGTLQAQLAAAPAAAAATLATMKHPWDYSQAVDDLIPMQALLADEAKRAIVDRVLRWYRAGLEAAGDAAPKGVIHGDVNWTNILMKPGGGGVCGVCDFGDVQYTHRVNELATSIAYGVLSRKHHVAVARAIVRGYTRHAALSDAERLLLPRAALARIAQSLVMGAYSYSVNPENEYLLETQRPGWEALDALVPAFMDAEGTDLLDTQRPAAPYDAQDAV
eukprot:TRINITY_DN9968_c1_g1_i1.p1 TRINITY_DN9968_c1_g1~~TRINITY_DN9968_c1_g1_i1.p1  ORF type:complete len:464 (+),score=172.00 TRINITY_DN9968_c1_g1_i1:148-1539(+)